MIPNICAKFEPNRWVYGPTELDPSELKLASKVKRGALFDKVVQIWPQIVSNTLKNPIFTFSDLWPSGIGRERAEVDFQGESRCALSENDRN